MVSKTTARHRASVGRTAPYAVTAYEGREAIGTYPADTLTDARKTAYGMVYRDEDVVARIYETRNGKRTLLGRVVQDFGTPTWLGEDGIVRTVSKDGKVSAPVTYFD